MVVNWQATDADIRLLAAVFAADPGIRPNTSATAAFYGRGASSHAITHRFQAIRKMAKELADEAERKGVQPAGGTPRTPRNPRTPRTPRTRSTGKSSAGISKRKLFDTPSKTSHHGNSVVDPITVDSGNDDGSDSDSDQKSVKSETTIPEDDEVKKEECYGDEKPKKKIEGFPLVSPFAGFGQAVRDDAALPRVSSQINGYVGAPEEAPQGSVGGYSYDMFADFM